MHVNCIVLYFMIMYCLIRNFYLVFFHCCVFRSTNYVLKTVFQRERKEIFQISSMQRVTLHVIYQTRGSVLHPIRNTEKWSEKTRRMGVLN